MWCPASPSPQWIVKLHLARKQCSDVQKGNAHSRKAKIAAVHRRSQDDDDDDCAHCHCRTGMRRTPCSTLTNGTRAASRRSQTVGSLCLLLFVPRSLRSSSFRLLYYVSTHRPPLDSAILSQSKANLPYCPRRTDDDRRDQQHLLPSCHGYR